jgi:hypothetical protein
VGPKLLRQRPGDANDGRLGEVVEERQPVVRRVVLGGAVRHLDDQSTPIPDQEGQGEVAGDDVRVDGEPQHALAVLQGVLPHRHVPLDQEVRPPDVVDEHVQSPLLALDPRDQGLDLDRVQVIDLGGDPLAARLAHQVGGLLDRLGTPQLRRLRAGRPPRAVHRGAGGAELDGDAAARAPRRPRDQRHSAAESWAHDASLESIHASDAIQLLRDRMALTLVAFPQSSRSETPGGSRPGVRGR